MTYKVLIVTSIVHQRYTSNSAAAVHSNVVEFNSLREADEAMIAVKTANGREREDAGTPTIRMYPLYKGG